MQSCTRVCAMYEFMHPCIHTCIYACIHTYVCTHMHTKVHTEDSYMHTCINRPTPIYIRSGSNILLELLALIYVIALFARKVGVVINRSHKFLSVAHCETCRPYSAVTKPVKRSSYTVCCFGK